MLTRSERFLYHFFVILIAANCGIFLKSLIEDSYTGKSISLFMFNCIFLCTVRHAYAYTLQKRLRSRTKTFPRL